jgi:fumarate reductase iron-sulfur subunit
MPGLREASVTELIASSGAGNTHRMLTLRIFRYNPLEAEKPPRFQSYRLEEADAMTLFIALNVLREEEDPGLQFDFVCRAGICGSCGMLINGKPGLACRTLTSSLPDTITLAPLPGFELIGDLSVNTGKWMRAMAERLESWVHPAEEEPDLDAMEPAMEPELARDIYELDRCIECGCCIAACGTAQMREDFVGAVGLNKIARVSLDPRDTRSDSDFYELLGDETGVFGCMTLLGCEDSCPKNLTLATQIAWLRRRMLGSAI